MKEMEEKVNGVTDINRTVTIVTAPRTYMTLGHVVIVLRGSKFTAGVRPFIRLIKP